MAISANSASQGQVMTPLVLMGGTFNPIHQGHIDAARFVSDALNSCVSLLPAAIPPLKDAPAADAQTRLALLDAATQPFPELKVDHCELQRSGVSYTIDTLRQKRAELDPEQPLIFVMGMDAWLSFTQWHCWQSFLDLAHLCVLQRPGYTPKNHPLASACVDNLQQVLQTACGSVLLLDNPLWEVSSTLIRQQLAEGQHPAHIPRAVWELIEQKQLYGYQQSV